MTDEPQAERGIVSVVLGLPLEDARRRSSAGLMIQQCAMRYPGSPLLASSTAPTSSCSGPALPGARSNWRSHDRSRREQPGRYRGMTHCRALCETPIS